MSIESSPRDSGGWRGRLAGVALTPRLPRFGGPLAARRWMILGAVVLALIQAALLSDTAWDKADTFDEPVYLAAAAILWRHGDFSANRGAPILPKWAFAVSLRLAGAGIEHVPPNRQAAIEFMASKRSGAELRRLLFAVRLTTVVVVVVAGLLLWRVALRFGVGVGFMTHALWCFSPTLLAHGSLATPDPWAAALSCVVLWTMVRFIERPGALGSAWVGLALAGAAACKVPTLGLVPLALSVMVWRTIQTCEPRFAARRAVLLLGICLAGFLSGLWMLYGFTIRTVAFEPGGLRVPMNGSTPGADGSRAPVRARRGS